MSLSVLRKVRGGTGVAAGGQGEAQMDTAVCVRKQLTTAEELCAAESGVAARQINIPSFSHETAV